MSGQHKIFPGETEIDGRKSEREDGEGDERS